MFPPSAADASSEMVSSVASAEPSLIRLRTPLRSFALRCLRAILELQISQVVLFPTLLVVVVWHSAVCFQSMCVQMHRLKSDQNNIYCFTQLSIVRLCYKVEPARGVYLQKYTANELDSSIRLSSLVPSRSSITSPPGFFCVINQLRISSSSFRSPA